MKNSMEMIKGGYAYHDKTRWWFNQVTKCAVSGEVVKKNYTAFICSQLQGHSVKDYVFFHEKKCNRDVLFTIYEMRFGQNNHNAGSYIWFRPDP